MRGKHTKTTHDRDEFLLLLLLLLLFATVQSIRLLSKFECVTPKLNRSLWLATYADIFCKSWVCAVYIVCLHVLPVTSSFIFIFFLVVTSVCCCCCSCDLEKREHWMMENGLLCVCAFRLIFIIYCYYSRNGFE